MIPNIWKNGYIGDFHSGEYHVCDRDAVRRTITQALITIKIMILKPEASLATSLTGRNVMVAAIDNPVTMIAQ